MIEKMNKTQGERFYGCSNFPSCRQTERVFEGVGTTDKSQTDQLRDSEEERMRLAQCRIQGREQLEGLALHYGVPGVAQQSDIMRSLVSGYGKRYDELTDEDRRIRGEYFLEVCGGMLIGRQLPYDKDDREPGLTLSRERRDE